MERPRLRQPRGDPLTYDSLLQRSVVNSTGSVCTQRNDQALKELCQARGWLHQPRQSKKLRSGLQRKHLATLARLRTDCKRGTWTNKTCSCGHQPTLRHVLRPCDDLAAKTRQLQTFADTHKLDDNDYLLPHQQLGLTPCRLLAEAIHDADIADWF